MNKAEFVELMAQKMEASKMDAEKALNTVLDGIQELLANGDSVTFVGFGTFKVSARAASAGHNPRTGESINIPASNAPGFKAGKALKDAVNKK